MDAYTAGVFLGPAMLIALCGYFGVTFLYTRKPLGMGLLLVAVVLSRTNPAFAGVLLFAGLLGYLKKRTQI